MSAVLPELLGYLGALGLTLVAPLAVLWAADVAGRAAQWI